MRLPSRRRFVALWLAALVALPAAAAADIESKGGYFEACFDRARGPGTRTVQWLWWPYRPVGSVAYVVYATCKRVDESGRYLGGNRVKFKNVTLRGVDSDQAISLRNRSVQLVGGRHPVVTWDAGAARSIAAETAVIGRAEIQIKGRIAAGDRLHCVIGMAEVWGGHLTAAAGD